MTEEVNEQLAKKPSLKLLEEDDSKHLMGKTSEKMLIGHVADPFTMKLLSNNSGTGGILGN